jgi:hypothetical protein
MGEQSDSREGSILINAKKIALVISFKAMVIFVILS